MKKLFSLLLLWCVVLPDAVARSRYSFNVGWLLRVGDFVGAESPDYSDSDWEQVSLPHAFNEDEAFAVDIHELTDTVVWYRKHFRLPAEANGQKVFLEFEGARQGVDCYVNGMLVGTHDNGVMAFGFDITRAMRPGADNVVAVRVDNDWNYRERTTRQRYQWSDKNFNANYGGLTKNVWLHVCGSVYQTLPLYSNLGTTGTYVYARDIDVDRRRALVHAESQVLNESDKTVNVQLSVELLETDGRRLGKWKSDKRQLAAGDTLVLAAEHSVNDLHFWSWGYGYLYDVRTMLLVNGKAVDELMIRTGFRKTDFSNGQIALNDRVMQVHGFAQRTSNEWPAVGMSVPAWLSDYNNNLMVEAGANLVRWMHVTPWKQDVESCDRVGLPQAMPAGDSERDVEGRRWEQRCELMRDALIYNRNNPSILFYECGNESISRDHMLEMRGLRDTYDPFGGRAIGSREMLDIDEAEYGGEMLYINKNARRPMWAMEYCRDEGLRKYWDEWSSPYHREGEGGPADKSAYNHNQDQFMVENVCRWYDYWLARPGGGDRCSSGGAKIVFSDTNTHFRGAENYRRSGDVDPMRIPKDSYFAHQVMWNGWVEPETPQIHICGHWNYPEGTEKEIYVVSNTDSVVLYRNGEPLLEHLRTYHFLFTFPGVLYEPGTLVAIGYNEGKPVASDTLRTAGSPVAIRLTEVERPLPWMADGNDLSLVEVEVVDHRGQRCPLANDTLHFSLEGCAQWRGGLAQGERNCILSYDLPVECGVNRILLRSTPTAGTVTLSATAEGLISDSLTLVTHPCPVTDGLTAYSASQLLPSRLSRGETPKGESYHVRAVDVPIVRAEAGCNQEEAKYSYDDNELSEWKNDGRRSTAWISYTLGREACVDQIVMKLTGWRMRSYPLDIYAGDRLIWSGDTERSLGYVYLNVQLVPSSVITIRLRGTAQEDDAFGQITEVTEPAAGELDLFKAKGGGETRSELRIVEVEFKEQMTSH